jgi:hypothetical protein
MFNTVANWWDVPGGLTLSSLPTLDPHSRPGSSGVDSLDIRSVHVPRTWNWSLGAIKRLPWQQTLELAYVGNRADHLPDRTIANYIVPGKLTGKVGNADLDNPLHRVALDESVAATFRNYPAYSQGSWWWQYEAVSQYNALQTTLSRSGTRVQYFLNYTFSKVLGTTGAGDYTTIDPIDARNRSYGIPNQDRTHIFNASYNVLLPDPVRPDGNLVLRGLLNGWQVSGISAHGLGLSCKRARKTCSSASTGRSAGGSTATSRAPGWPRPRRPRTGRPAHGGRACGCRRPAGSPSRAGPG